MLTLRKMISTRFSLLLLSIVGMHTVHSSSASLIVDLGGNGLAPPNGTVTTINDAGAYTSGSFITTAPGGSAGVSFDLVVTAFSGTVISQPAGTGVSGGTASSGIDNNNASGPQESLTLTISNFQGLAAGETLVITNVGTQFGFSPEVYTVNGGANAAFSSNSVFVIDVPDGVDVTIGAGSTGDTRFVLDNFTVAVAPVPEPTTALGLLGLVTGAFFRRRRRLLACC